MPCKWSLTKQGSINVMLLVGRGAVAPLTDYIYGGLERTDLVKALRSSGRARKRMDERDKDKKEEL